MKYTEALEEIRKDHNKVFYASTDYSEYKLECNDERIQLIDNLTDKVIPYLYINILDLKWRATEY